MSVQETVADQILKAVRRCPRCLLDDLVCTCADLTWNQIFLEVDRLSRTGQVRVHSKGRGSMLSRYQPRGKLLLIATMGCG